MSAFNTERLEKEDKGKLKVLLFLEQLGCKCVALEISKVLSLKTLDSETKRAFLEYKGTKYDLLVTRKKTKEFWLAEVKAKTKDKDKDIVNQEDYNYYYEFVSQDVPFLYFVYVDENGKLYRHEITNPKDFEKGIAWDEKPIYRIPETLFHEAKITSAAMKNLGMTLRLKQFLKMFK